MSAKSRSRSVPSVNTSPKHLALPATPAAPWDHLRLLWLLRIAARYDCPFGRYRRCEEWKEHREHTGRQSLYDEINRLTGFEPPINWELNLSLKPNAPFLEFTRRWLAVLEQQPLPRSGPPFTAAALLGQELGLNVVEQDIMLCAMLLHNDENFSDSSELFGELRPHQTFPVLAYLLGHPQADIQQALAKQGLLSRFGLVRLDRNSQGGCLRYRLDILNDLEILLVGEGPLDQHFFSRYLRQPAPGVLTRADFAHVAADVDLLLDLLRAAQAQQTKGVNVLIYGPPGTGKTELVRTLAAERGATLYTVSTEDHDNEPLSGNSRVSAYQIGQQLLQRQPQALVLFDEVEDVLPSHHDGGMSRYHKGWLHEVLEHNPVPGFWLCNSIAGMDRAFLRRFDVVLHLDIPPRAVRERLLRDRLSDEVVSPAWRQRLATLPDLSPGLIERVARVDALLGPTAQAVREQRLERLLSHTLRAMDLPHRPQEQLGRLGEYDLNLLNTSLPLVPLLDGLRRHGQGRLCLYGPPGTGKSAFAAYVAEVLERPLVYGTVADLLNCYVGETEKRIGALFREAEASGAVLLLDEADSLLRDRQAAQHSWEVTQTNQLLLCMERFCGVLICATNLMDQLDVAALRRFDVKLKFEYLTLAQAEHLCGTLLETTLSADDTRRLRQGLKPLTNLTPGDFAVVRRKLRFVAAVPDVVGLLRLLEEESRAKPDGQRQVMGFVNG